MELSDRELSGLRLTGTDDLHTGDLRTGYAADQDADLSAPFGAVAGLPGGAWNSAEGTGTFAGFFDETPPDDPDATDVVPITEVAVEASRPQRSEVRYGDRIEGWVRPQYQDQPEPVAGEYWTPVPAGSYETEYGWPVPVERLREVPLYPPPVGPDVPVEAEARPTAPAPQWPPARPDDRIESPRSWTDQSETGPAFRQSGNREESMADYAGETGVFGREVVHPEDAPAGPGPFAEGGLATEPYVREDEPSTDDIGQAAEAWPDTPDGGSAAPGLDVPIWTVPDRPAAAKPDFTWSPEEDERRPYRPPVIGPANAFSGDDVHRPPAMDYPYPEPVRARPRPHPRPASGRSDSRSTVYVSRHAGGPG